MKRFVLLICTIMLIFSVTACSKPGRTDKVTIKIGTSQKFSQEEINDAMDRVKHKFKDFKGCNLITLLYDEDVSNKEIDSYMLYGRGSINGVKPENVIILKSDFSVGPSGGNGSLNPNSTYTDWKWILIRNSETESWNINDWGY